MVRASPPNPPPMTATSYEPFILMQTIRKCENENGAMRKSTPACHFPSPFPTCHSLAIESFLHLHIHQHPSERPFPFNRAVHQPGPLHQPFYFFCGKTPQH